LHWPIFSSSHHPTQMDRPLPAPLYTRAARGGKR
jgi:hypothetical protein